MWLEWSGVPLQPGSMWVQFLSPSPDKKARSVDSGRAFLYLPAMYTKDNYFQWGSEPGRPFSLAPRDQTQARFWFDLCPTTILIRKMGLREASIQAAADIGKMTDRPLLFISGGIDSEAMMIAFKLARVPFDCVVLEYAYGMNRFEVDRAVKLCEIHDAPLIRHQINPYKVWAKMPLWMERYRLESCILHVCLQGISAFRDRFPVFGGIPMWEVVDDQLYLMFKPAYLARDMSWIDWKQSGVSYFHMYSPEQLRAWVTHPVIDAWSKQIAGTGIRSHEQIKQLVYQIEFPEITMSRPKLSGEENFWNLSVDLWKHRWAHNRPYNQPCRMPLSEVREKLGL